MRDDARQAQIQAFLTGTQEELILPAPVAAEIDYLLRRRGGPRVARAFLQTLADGVFRVESLSTEEHAMALEVHDRYESLDLASPTFQ